MTKEQRINALNFCLEKLNKSIAFNQLKQSEFVERQTKNQSQAIIEQNKIVSDYYNKEIFSDKLLITLVEKELKELEYA